jgi:PTH2 family peptidyl-tRNA hydrolase
MTELKQVIVIRTDIRMSIVKMIAQGAHASLLSYKKANFFKKINWENTGQKKVVLKVNSEKELLDLYENCNKEKIPCAIVKDAGKTELSPGTITALGIGPDDSTKIDKITGHLKLL